MVRLLSESPLIFTMSWNELFKLGRLDVKHATLTLFKDRLENIVRLWRTLGFDVLQFGQVVNKMDREIETKRLPNNKNLPLLTITFEGRAIPRVEKLKKKAKMTTISTKYQTLLRVAENDIVLSRIDLVNGAVAVIPEELDGYLVSKEFIVLHVKLQYNKIVDPWYVWAYLRSNFVKEYVKGFMKGVTGRHRIKWDQLKKLPFPIPATEDTIKAITEYVKQLKESIEEIKRALEKRQSALQGLYESLLTT